MKRSLEIIRGRWVFLRTRGAKQALWLVVAGLLVAGSWGCGLTAKEALANDQGDEELPGAALTLRRGDFVKELLLTGELEAVRSITIKSPETSLWQLRITYMAEEGEFVKEGEPLLSFDNSSLAAQVRELETQILDAETQVVAKKAEIASALKDLEIELAEKQYEYGRTKVEASIDPEVMSRKEFAERELAYEKATKELEETEERITLTTDRGQAELDVLVIDRDKLKRDLIQDQNYLDLLTINAPADGLVVYKKRQNTALRFQEGDSCWPGQGVMDLPDMSKMQISFAVSEVDAPLLEVGTSLRISLDAFPGRELTGEVRHIPSMATKRDDESKLRVFKVIADLSETWAGEMKPGMSVLGRIVIERKEDVPLLARRAVHFDGQDYWLRRADETQKPLRIEPLGRNAGWYLISEEEYARLSGEPAFAEMTRTAQGDRS